MSTKSKLIKNNQTIASSNKNLIAIKIAFLRPLPQYNRNNRRGLISSFLFYERMSNYGK